MDEIGVPWAAIAAAFGAMAAAIAKLWLDLRSQDARITKELEIERQKTAKLRDKLEGAHAEHHRLAVENAELRTRLANLKSSDESSEK